MGTGPTSELGAPNPAVTGGVGSLTPWASYYDDREYVPDLVWPSSLNVYQRMEASDAQLNGLLLGVFLPVRRLEYLIDPNGASAEVVKRAADDTGLPILGRSTPTKRARRRNRFNFNRHQAHALRSVVYGHYYFEQVGEIVDGKWRMRKLATRPPRTIAQIDVERNGSLKGIKQNGAWNSPPIPVNRLLAYVWDSQDDGDWVGRSMLRSVYRNWLSKDRLIRTDLTKHERNGMGVPWFEVDPNATDAQIAELARTATKFRAGEYSGGAGPGELHLKGVEGQLPDTIGSIGYHDKQMSRAFLQTFAELAGAENGSRALADSLIDWYVQGIDTVADWFCDVFTEHQLEDQVEWNEGDDEPSPVLVWRRTENEELAANDLAALINAGAIEVDDELEDAVRDAANLPQRSEPRAKPQPVPAPLQPGTEPAEDEGDEADDEGDPPASTQASRPRDHQRRALTEQIIEVVRAAGDEGAEWANVARAVDRDPKNGTARRARDAGIRAGAIRRTSSGTLRAGTTNLRRELFDHEVRAGTDFETMLGEQTSRRDSLVAAVKAAQGAQVEQIEAAVNDADGDLSQLAQVSAEPIDPEVIAAELRKAAEYGRRSAEDEARSQGVSAIKAAGETADELIEEQIADRSEALTLLLASSLSDAASRRAVAVAGPGMASSAIAAAVRDHLAGLTDAFLEEQLGGALVQAQNTARREVMRANGPQFVYASEVLDTNTCDPCDGVDGNEYPDVEAAEADYPTGGYIDCDGGLRCRGTLVAVYN